jgi:hypothetical protein
MHKTQRSKPDDPEQSKRFEETAHELEADEGGKAFNEAMDRVVRNRHQEEGELDSNK